MRAASPAPTARRLREALRRDRRKQPAAGLRGRARRLSRAVRRRHRRPRGAPRRRSRARACASRPARSAAAAVDRVVLGGLVEGAWPPETRSDAWLSRPMRHELGLDLPERRIGLSAHDFAQMLGAPRGDPHPRRQARRRADGRLALHAAARRGRGRSAGRRRSTRGDALSRLARAARPTPTSVKPAQRPAPTPPRAARPTRCSVTEIEHWLRDPYTIYAKHILQAARRSTRSTRRPAPPTAAPSSTARIGEFTQALRRQRCRPIRSASCSSSASKHFAALADYPEARAFWWPRFMRIARWFADWETARRARLTALARRDRRQDRDPARRARVQAARARRPHRARCRRPLRHPRLQDRPAPTEKQVRTGLAPQLTLEAAMLRQGGFTDIAAGASVAELVYVALTGGEPRRRSRCRSTSRTARPTSRPTTRWRD